MSAARADRVFGHRRTLDALRAAAADDRLPHALLFSGPEGVGKRTLAIAFARELIAGDDADAQDRFDRNVHDRFLLYENLDRPLPVRRGDVAGAAGGEDALLEAYAFLEKNGWLTGVHDARGADVVDFLVRAPEKFTGRKGIPFADVLEKELAALARARKAPPAVVEVARRIFSPGTSRAMYRRNLGIELINGKGDGEYFRTVDTLLRTSAGGAWRVAVIDDADRMTDAAENAFLKTLEEPPPSTLLILVTSEPLLLLPTTVSRCARIVFDSIAPARLAEHLTETQGVAADQAPLLAQLAGGSVRRALELRALDLGERRRFVERMVDAVADGDLGAALRLAGGCFAATARERNRDAERDEARVLLELLALSFRDLAVAACAPEVPPLSGMDARLTVERTGRRPASDWERLFARTETALSDVNRNVEPRLAVEALFADALPEAGAIG